MNDGFETVSRAIETRAGELPEVDRRMVDGEVEFQRAGRPFARVTSAGLAFRLQGRVASAARATPETGPSPAGPDWVLFRPSVSDRSAMDRATAWLELAWRRAAPGTGPE